MCGISGIFAQHITTEHIQVIDAIIASQHARGPDHQAKTIITADHSTVIFGHNRLSIIDLTDHANQPMWDKSQRYCLVYNGEIYNYLELKRALEQAGYVFQTQSDTEVILHAFAHWGIAALTHFYGPFAFALFDKQQETLWLCRDRFGVRPLFYLQRGQQLYFASSTAVLAKTVGLKPNLIYLAQGLNHLIYENDGEQTAYQHLLAIPAACFAEVKFQPQQLSFKLHTYYDLAQRVQQLIPQLPSQPTELIAHIDETLTDAVRIRLRADVPLAISLSGGLDSSSVAALVNTAHPQTVGFSFADPNHRQSEGPMVAQCAQYLQMPMEYVWPNVQEMCGAFFETIAVQDAPFSGLSIVAQYLLYKRVRACGIKVLLGGQGGDEAFMGYKKFLLFFLKDLWQQKKYGILIKQLWQLLPMLWAERSALSAYWQHRQRYLTSQGFNNQLLGQVNIALHAKPPTDLRERQLADITRYSLPTLLRYEDRNAMGNSVESRLPYLDHRLIELGLALSVHDKLHHGYGKWPIRQIMVNKIPNSIRLARYKRGFDVPRAPLIKAGLGAKIRTQLQQNSHVLTDFLQKSILVQQQFSDRQLLQRPNAMSEAITLLWLNKVLA